MKQTKKIIFLVYFFVFPIITVFAHPFYVSICQVDYNNTNQSIEISIKTFADDLLLGLENVGVTKIYLGEEREDPKADQYIYDYLQSKLQFNVNGEDYDFNFVGYEFENDVVWIYLEIVNVKTLSEIEITNCFLTEVYDSQSNIIQINNGGEIKSLLLTKRNNTDKIEF